MAQPEPCTYSGTLSVGTTTVSAKSGLLWAITLHPGSAASSITVYDNSSAGSGNVVAFLQGVSSGGTQALPLLAPVMYLNGITVVIAGTGATANVYFTRSF